MAWFLALGIAAIAGAASAKEQSASVSASVAAGQIHTTRLLSLPESAFISIAIEVDDQVSLSLVDEPNAKRPAASRKPLLSGETADKLTLGARIPKSGTYYVIVDNGQGKAARQFKLKVTARVESDSSAVAAKVGKVNEELERFEASLRRHFVFDELAFRLASCGTGNAFSGGDTVIICTEIGTRLREVMGDDAKARDALLFAMMHEVGHVLLQQWGYPFYQNEEVADEFATALLVLFGHGERARSQAEFFSKQSPEKEFAAKRDRDDRHPLSDQRARNILRWLDDPDLLKRWQKVLVPHMQTDVLEKMTRSTNAWIDHDLVSRELALRGKEKSGVP